MQPISALYIQFKFHKISLKSRWSFIEWLCENTTLSDFEIHKREDKCDTIDASRLYKKNLKSDYSQEPELGLMNLEFQRKPKQPKHKKSNES